MKIHLHEITEQDTELNFTQEELWVTDAVEKVDEKPVEKPRPALVKNKPARPIDVHFNLRKVDNVVVVDGSVRTHINLLCSRCANPFELTCRPNFSALFCKDPVMAGVAHLQQEGRPAGQNKGFARHAHDFDADSSEAKDLDITYLSQDVIDLSELLTEQLQLQVPFQPLCQDECKGICSNCGADLNAGRCACAKIASSHPFSALRDLKL